MYRFSRLNKKRRNGQTLTDSGSISLNGPKLIVDPRTEEGESFEYDSIEELASL
jgi:hypothetical protein